MSKEIFRPIVRAWMEKVRKAHEHKKEEFGNDAKECMRYLDGPYDFLYAGPKNRYFGLASETSVPNPTFRMTYNKAAEIQQLYGPALYARNPYRQVTLRRQSDYPLDLVGDPQMQQMLAQQMQLAARAKEVGAELMGELLNYTPNELDLRLHSRRAIDESLLKGMGVMWTEPVIPYGSPYTFIGSFYDSVDNLLLDPDATVIQEGTYCIRRKVRPKWRVAQERGIPLDELRGSIESANMQAEIASISPDQDYFRASGNSNDLLVYFEIYSRMGLGHKLRRMFNREIAAGSEILDQFGDHVYLEVCDEYDCPLNVPRAVAERGNMEEIAERLAWPTPFYLDPTDPWPFSYLAFHERPNSQWPYSHLKPVLGQLSFLNWAMSFLADKVKNTSRDFIATGMTIDEDLEQQILGGGDLSLLKFDNLSGRTINDVIQFLQHPQMNKDPLLVVDMLKQAFDDGAGLNELMYGRTRRQLRSAAEANVRSDTMRIRPDDMAECVEAWSTKQARKEAVASYWHLKTNDVLPILGQERAQLYSQTVMQMDPREVMYEFNIRIEAGSIRKPNRDKDLANVNEAIRVWGPVVQAYAQLTGDFEPLNFLANQWEKVNDMEPRGIRFNPPPPPRPDQTAIQQAQMEMEMMQQEHQQKLQHKQEEHQQKLGQTAEGTIMKTQLDAMKAGGGMEMDEAKHGQEMRQDEERHDQELTQDQQKHLQELLQARAEGNLDLVLKRQLGEVQARQAAKPKAKASSNGK